MTTPLLQEFPNIMALQDALAARKLSVSELTRSCLAAARANAQNAWLFIAEERALEQARLADERIARDGEGAFGTQPLLGVPLGIKDILTVRGMRTTCGSKMLENYLPPYTATCVERLERAGVVTLGKLNMDEFGMGGSNENSAFGPVAHPTHPDRVPGGSSGGSAAAVRAGDCLVALGSDTGGSIRLPAAYCGVVGLKPTYGRVSRYGLIAFASSLDQAGPLCRSTEDAARVFEVMAGHDSRDSTSLPAPLASVRQRLLLSKESLQGLRIGVPKEFFVEGISPEVDAAVRAALRWYEAQGASLVPVSLPHTPYSVAVYYVVAVSEASSNLGRYDGVRYGARPPEAAHASDLADFYRRVRSLFGPEVKRRIILGTFALSSGYADAYYHRACQVRRLIQRDFEQVFNEVDLIAGPVAPTTAFKRGEKVSDPLQMYLNDIFTIPANLAGLPALSVPCGEDAAGLPIGLQLIGPQLEEARLLQAAHAYEQGRLA